MRISMLSVAAVLMLGAAVPVAQDEARFSARSELVILDVAVTDDRGGFVSGLPANAIEPFGRAVCEVRRAFLPPRAGCGTPICLGRGRARAEPKPAVGTRLAIAI